jgi:leucyl-tRNA synthetase
LCALQGHDLIGLPLSAPRAPYATVYTLPLLSISMGKGTGVVTSVPSDAPDDYVALKELQVEASLLVFFSPQIDSTDDCARAQAKPEFRKKFGLTDEMVMPFEVVPIINITVPASGDDEGWSSDTAAQYWADKLKIKTAGERAKLDEVAIRSLPSVRPLKRRDRRRPSTRPTTPVSPLV